MEEQTREKAPAGTAGNGGSSAGRRQDEVAVSINNVDKQIHRGHQSVEAIKRAGGVALADELVQVIEGQLVPLGDAASVVIKGGERFISQPRDSASSHEERRF